MGRPVLVRRRVSLDQLRVNNEVAGFKFATVGVLEYVDWASGVVEEPLCIEGGNAVIPDRPGCGLKWDDNAVQKHRVS
jgi:L-alanine-DL-glutamate epimerase-like enolase superfamily enzyme